MAIYAGYHPSCLRNGDSWIWKLPKALTVGWECKTHSTIIFAVELDFALNVLVIVAVSLRTCCDIYDSEHILATMNDTRSSATTMCLDEGARDWWVVYWILRIWTLDCTVIPADRTLRGYWAILQRRSRGCKNAYRSCGVLLMKKTLLPRPELKKDRRPKT